MRWLRNIFGSKQNRDAPSAAAQVIAAFNAEQARIKKAGSVEDAHYTDHVEQIKALKREKRNEEAIALLLRIVDATEAESKAAGPGWGVAPWYYEQLAILYRKEKRFADEVAILERYASQPKAPGVGASKLAERLIKAREIEASKRQVQR